MPKRKSRRIPALAYAPGFFTALIQRHNWPPNFVPQYRSDKSPTPPPRGSGYDKHPLGLPGATAYVVMFEANNARKP